MLAYSTLCVTFAFYAFLLQLITIMSCSLFSGAALYINVVEHPAQMACGTKLASTVFGPSYRRAAVMQVSLALITTIFAILSWSMTKTEYWLIGALWIFSVIPFTLFMIAPTNKKLLNPNLDLGSANTQRTARSLGTTTRSQNCSKS